MPDAPLSLQVRSPSSKSESSPWHSNRNRTMSDHTCLTWQRPDTSPSNLSASTVTASSGSDNSSQNSNDSPASPPTAAAKPSQSRWIDEFEETDELFERAPISLPFPPHSRPLPRIGVVSFRKEGENLRWAPRVTENTGGVAARVHNFEDAFTLEEFSSRALPVVWKSTGGNPRLSSVTDDDLPTAYVPDKKDAAETPSTKTPWSTSNQSKDLNVDSFSRLSASHRRMARNSSLKRTMALAADLSRPPIWSLFSYNDKYRKIKAQNQQRIKSSKDGHTEAKVSTGLIGFRVPRYSPLSRRERRANAARATKVSHLHRSSSKCSESKYVSSKRRQAKRATKRSTFGTRWHEKSSEHSGRSKGLGSHNVLKKLFRKFDRKSEDDDDRPLDFGLPSESSGLSDRCVEKDVEKDGSEVRRSKSMWRYYRKSLDGHRVRNDRHRRMKGHLCTGAQRSRSNDVSMYDDQYVSFITSKGDVH